MSECAVDDERCADLPRSIWAVASIFLGTYAIVQNINVPIIVSMNGDRREDSMRADLSPRDVQLQPQLFGVLAALSWCQCLYYQHGFSFWKAFSIYATFCAIFGGFEGGMFVVLRVSPCVSAAVDMY